MKVDYCCSTQGLIFTNVNDCISSVKQHQSNSLFGRTSYIYICLCMHGYNIYMYIYLYIYTQTSKSMFRCKVKQTHLCPLSYSRKLPHAIYTSKHCLQCYHGYNQDSRARTGSTCKVQLTKTSIINYNKFSQ